MASRRQRRLRRGSEAATGAEPCLEDTNDPKSLAGLPKARTVRVPRGSGDRRGALRDHEDSPAVTGLSVPGGSLDERSTLDDVLSFVRGCMARGAVKVEAEEALEQSHTVTSMQKKLLLQLERGAWRFDPSRDASAWEMQKHLANELPIDSLRYTHNVVNDRFLNGHHRGELVSQLTNDLLEGKTALSEVTALVVVVLNSVPWVVCGNRRLKALKDFREKGGGDLRVRCIVYDADHMAIPHAVLAKFLLGASTHNNGESAPFRSTLASAGGAGCVVW